MVDIDLNGEPEHENGTILDTPKANPPTVGMCFPSGYEFSEFCHRYAFEQGFEMFVASDILKTEYKAKGVSKKGVGELEARPHMMDRLRFKCKKGGVKKSEGSNVTGCKMFVYGRVKNGEFVLVSCDLKHNHPLSPDCSRMMVNYRSIDGPTFDRIMINERAGVSISRNFGTQLIEKGGFDNMTFNKKDVRDAIAVERRKTMFEKGDAAGLEDYFKSQRELNCDFYSSMQRDEEGILKNSFWSDARSRGACKYFGDVISFDTTFSSNRYRMPFAPFVGVNHHGKSIVFAAALISHEDTESFIWVFEEWLKCMGKPPKGILTDQDKAIARAISEVFPGVPHRLCLWHMLQNASRNLGKLAEWKSIDTLIRTAVHDMLDPNEFDEAWCLVMDKYNQRGKGWMQDAYDNRQQWAPAYNRGTFWAGMSSTQRSEGMNRYFKNHVDLECGLVQFIKNYEFCMNIKAEEEKEDNFDSVDTPPQLDVDKSVLAEYVFRKVYTNAMFADVVHERKGLTHTNVTRTDSLGSLVLYRADEKLTSPHWRKRYKSYNVKVDKVKGELSCSCQLFEFRGILCRHILKAMDVEDFQFVPEKYILDRWRKQVRSYESIRVSYYDPEESKRLAKAKELTQRHNYLRELAMHNEEAYKLYTEATDALRIKMEDVVGLRKTGNVGDNSICWWDPEARNVFGRSRLRPREHNERALKRLAQPPEEGVIKTPVDKRHVGRPKKGAYSIYDKSKKNLASTHAEIAANEELIRSTYGHIPSYRDRQEHANNVHDACVNLSYNGPVLEDIPESSQINLSEDVSQTFDYDAFVWRKRPGGRMTL
ncbi:protein FAR1-RELATED SEQUENCE 5-like [Spinacia oleracea]|uniref:Protein FAR1-RELATED SEQUENCE 5-like n=1 Tax=Spinacia oleracea TaxID=3562 RepID=A0ABM3QQR0_SPIOL|nr:protein FAR1-RELATED SEQUENCE 5-like [Spinacia oleracea]